MRIRPVWRLTNPNRRKSSSCLRLNTDGEVSRSSNRRSIASRDSAAAAHDPFLDIRSGAVAQNFRLTANDVDHARSHRINRHDPALSHAVYDALGLGRGCVSVVGQNVKLSCGWHLRADRRWNVPWRFDLAIGRLHGVKDGEGGPLLRRELKLRGWSNYPLRGSQLAGVHIAGEVVGSDLAVVPPRVFCAPLFRTTATGCAVSMGAWSAYRAPTPRRSMPATRSLFRPPGLRQPANCGQQDARPITPGAGD